MNEYQDQDVRFEVYEDNGFQWEFVADFDTREEAVAYIDGSAEFRVKRVSGQA